MGEVYAATQTEPIERDVALKVIRADRVSSRMLARFRAELSTLSLMQHDAIAQIYDAGEMPDGRPFFVMERVDGAPQTFQGPNRPMNLPSGLPSDWAGAYSAAWADIGTYRTARQSSSMAVPMAVSGSW